MTRIARPRSSAGKPASVEAERVPVQGARPLVYVGPESPMWGIGAAGVGHAGNVEAAIVWLRPPRDVSDAVVGSVAMEIRNRGGAVKLLPPPSASRVALEAPEAPAFEAASVRAVVLGLVDEARTVDRDALRRVTADALDVVGI